MSLKPEFIKFLAQFFVKCAKSITFDRKLFFSNPERMIALAVSSIGTVMLNNRIKDSALTEIVATLIFDLSEGGIENLIRQMRLHFGSKFSAKDEEEIRTWLSREQNRKPREILMIVRDLKSEVRTYVPDASRDSLSEMIQNAATRVRAARRAL